MFTWRGKQAWNELETRAHVKLEPAALQNETWFQSDLVHKAVIGFELETCQSWIFSLNFGQIYCVLFFFRHKENIVIDK